MYSCPESLVEVTDIIGIKLEISKYGENSFGSFFTLRKRFDYFFISRDLFFEFCFAVF